jgi:hypothetical protein
MWNFLDLVFVGLIVLIPVLFIAIFVVGLTTLFSAPACSMEKLATISKNPFIGDSTSNPFSAWNNPFNPKSPHNQFGPYGNRFSNYSYNNPYATKSPGIYGYADGPADEDNSGPSAYIGNEYGGGADGLGDYE